MKPTEDEIVAKVTADGDICQLAVDVGLWAAAEAERLTVDDIVDWIIARRAEVGEARDEHAKIKPEDKAAHSQYGLHLNTLQEVLDYCVTLANTKDTGGEWDG